jgi:hypothetical protein
MKRGKWFFGLVKGWARDGEKTVVRRKPFIGPEVSFCILKFFNSAFHR